MKTLQALSFPSLCARIDEPKNTLILFHRSPDADAVGSAFALKRLLTSLGSRAWCVCGNELPDRLRFLADGEQSSVLPAAIPEGFRAERIIAVDTASPAQLGDLRERFEEKVDLMIDHHGNGEPFADHYILPHAAATGEILFDLIRHFSKEKATSVPDEVRVDLYAAISSDTGGFRYSNVTPETHQRAAELVASGIDCADINHRLFESMSMQQIRANGAGASRLQTFADGKLSAIVFPYSLKTELGLADEHLDTLIDVARSLEGVQVAMVLRQPSPEPVFRVSMRSACNFDVAALCAVFGGGGHKRAAGCTVHAADPDAALRQILDAVDLSALN